MRRTAFSAALLVLGLALPLAAQVPAEAIPAPPPGQVVPRERHFALGLGFGTLGWPDEAPYDDHSMTSLALERIVMRGVRGRAALGYGETTVLLEDPADTRVLAIDLQLLLVADFGPFRAIGVEPYALGGVGSLVVNPVGEGGRELPTRSQNQLTWGGGVLARLGSRWEARIEAVKARVQLADPEDGENQDTTRIHTSRWEGRIDWLF